VVGGNVNPAASSPGGPCVNSHSRFPQRRAFFLLSPPPPHYYTIDYRVIGIAMSVTSVRNYCARSLMMTAPFTCSAYFDHPAYGHSCDRERSSPRWARWLPAINPKRHM